MGWAKKSMEDAIQLLANLGRNDIASDLSRLITSIDFEDLEVLRSNRADQIASKIVEASTISDLTIIISEIRTVFRVNHVTLNVINESSSTNFSPRVLTTYPKEWVSQYVNRRYSILDPVSRASRMGDRGFFWHLLENPTPAQRAFWADAFEHGIGPVGYTQPMTTERGDRLALSFCSDEQQDSFYDRMQRYESDIYSLAIYLSDAFCTLASESRPSSFSVTDDQMMVLRAIGMGAEEKDLENLHYQFGSFSTVKKSICFIFRTKTLAQAAVIAARVGLLTEAPLTSADILTASGQQKAEKGEDFDLSAPLRRLARLRHPSVESEVANAAHPIAKHRWGSDS